MKLPYFVSLISFFNGFLYLIALSRMIYTSSIIFFLTDESILWDSQQKPYTCRPVSVDMNACDSQEMSMLTSILRIKLERSRSDTMLDNCESRKFQTISDMSLHSELAMFIRFVVRKLCRVGMRLEAILFPQGPQPLQHTTVNRHLCFNQQSRTDNHHLL